MARIRFLQIKPSEFFQAVQGKTGLTFRKLAKICEVHQRTILDWKNEKSLMPFSAFKKLCRVGRVKHFSVQILPDYWQVKNAARKGAFARYKIYGNFGTSAGRSKGGRVTYQKFISNPKLAKKLGFRIAKQINHPKKSPMLAELVGILIGDGGITDYQVRVILNKETDKEYSRYVTKTFRYLFHLESTIREEKDEKVCEVVISSRNLVKYLRKLGLKKGNKIRQQIDIPDWIKRNEKLTIACLRGLVDTDGSFYVDIHKLKNRYYFNPGLVFTTCSLPLFLSVKKILRELNYHPTGNKRNIFLRREGEIIRYFKEIGSNNPKHILKFEEFLRNHRK